jgi:ethanolamine utilization protein EutJ
MLMALPSNDDRVTAATAFLNAAARRLRRPAARISGALRFGVDLGTATVVLTALDESDAPVYWDFLPCEAVRDGVVVNFGDAVAAVRKLKADAEEKLGVVVMSAGTAYPPGVPVSDSRACRFVLESAGIDCRSLVDEVSAAQELLKLRSGVIVDVGGGSTGVGVVEGGAIVLLDDRPGGGRHLDLILAGALRISTDEAERLKRRKPADYMDILRPGVERVAASVQRQIDGRSVSSVHLVGGALRLPGADLIVAEYLGINTVAYPHAELVTPFGIAASKNT